jgi:hypothetical protein
MSTNGCIGVRTAGKDYFQYNHSDSYPSHLGFEMLKAARQLSVERLREAAASWTLVDDQDVLTAEWFDKLQPLLAQPGEDTRAMAKRLNGNSQESGGVVFYEALREFQGDLVAWVEQGIPVWLQSEYLPIGSDWGYLIDCDAHVFEVYTNHYKMSPAVLQRLKTLGNRFVDLATEPDDRPMALIAAVPLGDLVDLPDAVARVWCDDLERRTRGRGNDYFIKHPGVGSKASRRIAA